MSVLPWPGVSAWPAPRAIASRIDRTATSGVRSARNRSGMSPDTPPGTAAGPGVAVGAAVAATPDSPGDVVGEAPARGWASGAVNVGSGLPPAATRNVTE